MTTHLTLDSLARGSPSNLASQAPCTVEQAASVRRHPSSGLASSGGDACPQCGFRRPARAVLASALVELPEAWSRRLEAVTSADLEAAARVRDELHVVANRVDRLLISPGTAVLASISIDVPAGRSRAVSAPHLRTLLGIAADRLATLVRSLQPDDWQIEGSIGSRRVGAEDLVALALHRSHARLVGGAPCR